MPKKKEKAIMAWSGGKDSSFALDELWRSPEIEISSLLTPLTEDYSRISMHGIRQSLLHQQAASLGIPLIEVFIPKNSDMQIYESRMEEALFHQKETGVSTVIFGDIFLEDLRSYREENLASLGLKAFFPLWKRDTSELAQEFIRKGFKASLACVDTALLDESFSGRPFDSQLLIDLPPEVDPCGENGEFHTFVHDGPIFNYPIAHTRGERVIRNEHFCFIDFVPQAQLETKPFA